MCRNIPHLYQRHQSPQRNQSPQPAGICSKAAAGSLFIRRISARLILLSLTMLVAACGGGGGGSSAAPAQTATTPNASDGPNADDNSNPAPQLPPAAAVEVKLLALYTAGVAAQYSDPVLRIQHVTNVANDVVSNSGADLQFTLAASQQIDYPDGLTMEQALEDLTHNQHAAFTQVSSLRDSYQADVVVLLRPYANDGRCGLAWVGGYQQNGDFSHPAEADFAFSVVASNCSDYTLLHELGHNLGLAHSRREDPDGGTYPYAVGYGEDNAFATIMATGSEFNAPRLPLLSSPAPLCQGQPCGIAFDQPQGADAVQTLAVSARQVAEYR